MWAAADLWARWGKRIAFSPGLSIGDRARAVRRGSAQPTVHKFTASARHGVRRPVPSQPLSGRGKPRAVFASRAPDADVADYTSQRTRQDCAFVRFHWPLGVGRPIRASRSTTSARRRCCRAAPASIHADRDPMIAQHLGELRAGELRPRFREGRLWFGWSIVLPRRR